MMPASAIFFYVIAGVILVTAILSVTTRRIFRAAIWLLFSLMGIAGVYFWLDMNFLAAVQIVVYVGGIVVLIIFSVFLTQGSGQSLPVPAKFRLFFSALAVSMGLAFTIWILHGYGFLVTAPDVPAVEMREIGKTMLSVQSGGYALPFELVSILLLAAMVACIAIAMKIPADKKNE
jgi:NADH-quinone oxidoreductase subunit J